MYVFSMNKKFSYSYIYVIHDFGYYSLSYGVRRMYLQGIFENPLKFEAAATV